MLDLRILIKLTRHKCWLHSMCETLVRTIFWLNGFSLNWVYMVIWSKIQLMVVQTAAKLLKVFSSNK